MNNYFKNIKNVFVKIKISLKMFDAFSGLYYELNTRWLGFIFHFQHISSQTTYNWAE